jgi:folate-dependent phosphoribosylglycinamide formyltransferase PurN
VVGTTPRRTVTMTTTPHHDELAGMTACLIVDGDHIERFAREALALAVERGLRVTCAVVCDNTVVPRKPLQHGAYYLYKLLFLRDPWTRAVPWAPLTVPDVAICHFESDWEGIWQRIPDATLRFIAEKQVDVVLRFGMTLLRDPDDVPATHGVLSFHHGDPSQYRGRPAGFYEVRDRADHLGIMVQRLTNRLDAGNVLAYGAVQVQPHSYRRTLEHAFANSRYLLVKALQNLQRGASVDRATDGRNYRLPSNLMVLRFALELLGRKLRRLHYGLTMEKRWRLTTVEPVDLVALEADTELHPSQDLPIPRGFSLLADPAVVDDETLLCEGVDARSGRGHLLGLRGDAVWKIDTRVLGRGHLSYPHVVRDGHEVQVLPEMAQIGAQQIARLTSDHRRLVDPRPLRGLEGVRLTDPTLLHNGNRWWLFAGRPGSAADLLFLWSAPEITGPYVRHPDSPIVLDPACARMAGAIQSREGRLFRLGQDNRRRYGDGIAVCEIVTLHVDRYREVHRAHVRMRDGHGPHAFGVWSDRSIVDRYDEVRASGAGLRRVRPRLPSVKGGWQPPAGRRGDVSER